MKISRVISLLTSQLVKHLTLVFAGNIFAAGLGFIAVLIISRGLSVSDYGLFNIAISVILIAPQLAGLGMGTSMIRFTSSYLSIDKTAEAVAVLRVTLYVRLITSFIIAVIIFNTANFLSSRVFHNIDLTPLLKLTAFGVPVVAIFNYLKSVLFTYQSFKKYVLLKLLVDFAKLSTVVVLILYLKMIVFYAVAVFTIIPLLGVLLGFWQIRDKIFSKRNPVKNITNRLLSYSKWTFTSIVCRLLFPHIGIFMLANMLSSKDAGIYGLALNLTYIFPILIASLRSVLLPEVSRFKERAQFEKYIKGSLKISLYLVAFIIPFLFLSEKIILLLFGPRYFDSVNIFNWLLLSYISVAIGSTIRTALYSMNRPHTVALVDLFRVTTMVSGCYFLIPFLGVLAPAVLSLVINIGALGFLILYVFRHVYKEELVFQEEIAKIAPF